MLSFFQKKENILEAGILKGMTDIHSHFLPEVDDGSQSTDDTLSALAYMQAAGIRRIYLTPHIMADYSLNHPAFLRKRFQALTKKYTGEIELKLAGEYMLDSGFAPQMAGGLLTMAGNHLLVETSYLSPPPDLKNMLYEITIEGYTPIIAHPERYLYMNEKDYARLKAKSYKLQLNLFSLAGVYGNPVRERAEHLLKEDMYDFTGSDFHRLPDYERGIKELNLNSRQIEKLKQLIANNEGLW